MAIVGMTRRCKFVDIVLKISINSIYLKLNKIFPMFKNTCMDIRR